MSEKIAPLSEAELEHIKYLDDLHPYGAGEVTRLLATIAHQAEQMKAKDEAIQPLVEQWRAYKESNLNQESAYYMLAKSHWEKWDALEAALTPGDPT